jgi:hypothetical protein
MAHLVGRKRFINFRIVDVDSVPQSGRVLGDFQILFTRDGSSCSDALSLINSGSGRYILEYTPSAAGFDFLEVYDSPTDIRVQDEEEIDTIDSLFAIGAFTVNLTQDYGGVSALKPDVSDPLNWTLFVYLSQDWQVGRREVDNAIGSTNLNAGGNWITTPIPVPINQTYHIIVKSNDDRTKVIAPFLKV